MHNPNANSFVIPGTTEGLLRTCSPIVSLINGVKGIVLRLGPTPDTADIVWMGEAMGEVDSLEHDVPLDTIALDLTNKTGWIHTAWCLGHELVPGSRP